MRREIFVAKEKGGMIVTGTVIWYNTANEVE